MMEDLLQVSLSLDIRSSTWSRDTHQLYDYESKLVTKASFKTGDQGKVVRQGDQCSFLNRSVSFIPQSNVPLITLQRRENSFLIHQQGPEYTQQDKLWMVVKFLKNSGSSKGYKLKVDDWIKIGRVKLHVKAIYSSNTQLPDRVSKSTWFIDKDLRSSVPLTLFPNQEKDPCRICLFDDSTQQNPLISPCSCSGSMKNVHLQCLQGWLNNKIVTRQSNKAASYYWKDLSCELCKEKLPCDIEIDGVQKELIRIQYPDPPYMILQDLRPERHQNAGLHVVSLALNQSLMIGRGHESDIKLPDISVSRQHSKIRYTSKGFFLEDHQSKFGSLILIQEPVFLKKDEEITLQINRSLLSLSAKQPWSCKGCMGCGKKKTKVMPFNQTSGLTNEEIGQMRRNPSIQAPSTMRQSIEDPVSDE